MNIILQSKETGKIILLTKGADSMIGNYVDFESQIFIEEKAGEMSRDGLRTLAFCFKEISQI